LAHLRSAAHAADQLNADQIREMTAPVRSFCAASRPCTACMLLGDSPSALVIPLRSSFDRTRGSQDRVMVLCPVPACEKRFSTKKQALDHIEKYHRVAESEGELPPALPPVRARMRVAVHARARPAFRSRALSFTQYCSSTLLHVL
jgi:hypothetical protein